MSQNAVNLVRVFCFEDGYGLSNTPIQKSPGNYDENGLKRIDLILSQAAAYGIYLIVVPTNFEPVGGGIQWYVDNVSSHLTATCLADCSRVIVWQPSNLHEQPPSAFRVVEAGRWVALPVYSSVGSSEASSTYGPLQTISWPVCLATLIRT